MVLPLVNHGTDPTHEEFLFLFEEALELWEALLHYTTTSTPDLLALIPRSIECLSLGSEHLKVVLKVINSYLYLEPEMMLRVRYAQVVRILTESDAGALVWTTTCSYNSAGAAQTTGLPDDMSDT